MRLKIPWKRLKSEPAVINIERLFLLAAPKSEKESNAKERKEKDYLIKKRNLQLADLMNSDQNAQEDELPPLDENVNSSGGGYFSAYTSLIVNNLQIYIDQVHIRYEDEISNPKVLCPNLKKKIFDLF